MTLPCQLLLDCSLHLAGVKGVPASFAYDSSQTPLTPAAVQAFFPEALAGKQPVCDLVSKVRLHKILDTIPKTATLAW